VCHYDCQSGGIGDFYGFIIRGDDHAAYDPISGIKVESGR
jgi:hypothetical protein